MPPPTGAQVVVQVAGTEPGGMPVPGSAWPGGCHRFGWTGPPNRAMTTRPFRKDRLCPLGDPGPPPIPPSAKLWDSPAAADPGLLPTLKSVVAGSATPETKIQVSRVANSFARPLEGQTATVANVGYRSQMCQAYGPVVGSGYTDDAYARALARLMGECQERCRGTVTTAISEAHLCARRRSGPRRTEHARRTARQHRCNANRGPSLARPSVAAGAGGPTRRPRRRLGV